MNKVLKLVEEWKISISLKWIKEDFKYSRFTREEIHKALDIILDSD